MPIQCFPSCVLITVTVMKKKGGEKKKKKKRGKQNHITGVVLAFGDKTN